MATENFSFGHKKINSVSALLLAALLTACQLTSKHGARPEPTPTQPSSSRPSETTPAPSPQEERPESPAAPLQVGVAPKIGLILGPGALRAYAHVGVVQEFAKEKMPIHIVAGIEMGALVAAIYANKGQPYDVEWQMMKLKESDLVQKTLLSNQVRPGDVRSLREFMNISLSSNRAENAKVSFACPALQIDKQQVYMMNKGVFSDMLPYCLAMPPLFRPYQRNVAAVLSLKSVVDYMRSKGANYVIYVDLLSGPLRARNTEMETQVLWNLAAEALNHQEKGLDYIVHVPLKDMDLLDFGRRREAIQRGQKAAVEATSQITKSVNW